MFVMVRKILYYCFIHYIVFISALFMKKKTIKYLGLFMSLSSFVYRCMTSHGFSAKDHSKANIQLCGIFLTFLIIITVWVYCAALSFKKSRKCFGIYMVVWCVLWSSFYWARVARSCEHLHDSLHPDDKYSDSVGECKWVESKICWNYTVEGMFKPFYWGRKKCENVVDDLTVHKKIMGKNKIVSYPLMTKFSY